MAEMGLPPSRCPRGSCCEGSTWNYARDPTYAPSARSAAWRSLRGMATLTSTSWPPPTHSATRSKALKASEELALQRALERQQSEAAESPGVQNQTAGVLSLMEA